MAVYITGDVHGKDGVQLRLNTSSFYEQKEFNINNKDENIVIILGDFGCIWNNNSYGTMKDLTILPAEDGEHKSETYTLDWLSKKPFTTVFVDGNHDNHPRIYTYPIVEWHGGKAHKIRENVFHLIRGEIYEIEGKKFFAFGGAQSHDIQDGILDPTDYNSYNDFKDVYNEYVKSYRMFRVNHVSWWETELPTNEEMEHGIQNLEKHNFKVDYVLSHDCPTFVSSFLSRGFYNFNILNNYFQDLIYTYGLDYNRWFFGHYHDNRNILDKFTLLYDQITRII